MNSKISETLSGILEIFKSGDIPQAVSYAAFPPFDIPSEEWSYLNRILMWMSGTYDARGYRQWKKVGRHVKKGVTAIYIFAPRFKKENDVEELLGFLQVPVFRYEDTEGEPLGYKRTEINSLPLIEKAKEWGLDVNVVAGNKGFWGAYNGTDIKLATLEEAVFFHELSHHAHKLVIGELVKGQDWKQEIVAELSAEALSRIFGLKTTTGNSYRYIERYAKEAGLTPVAGCLQVLSDVEKVLTVVNDKQRFYLVAIICTLARIREINNLKWEDVHEDYLVLKTRKAKNSDLTERAIAFNDTLKYIMQVIPKESEYVFYHPKTKKKYDYRSKLLKRACEKAKVKEFGYHALRHYGASKLADAGVPITDIQLILGHQRPTTTDIYLQSIRPSLKEAMKKLEFPIKVTYEVK